MASSQTVTDFVDLMSGYAEQAAAATGLDPRLILAQWGNETAWGTSYAEPNNVGNVGVYSGGPNQGFPTLQAGVQAYINEMNSPAMASVKATAGQSVQAQAAALGASGYASGQYNDGSGPGSSLLADMSTAGFGSFPQGQNSAPQAQVAGSANSSGTLPATAAQTAAAGGTTDITVPGYGNVAASTNAVSGYDQVLQTLQAYGMSPADAATIGGWAWSQITANVDPSQIVTDIQTPGTAPYAVFEKYFPGYVSANAELTQSGLPTLSVSQYSQYQTTVMASAQAAGLPAGFINKNDIGTLVGHNVSAAEITSRLNDATMLAYQSTPQQVNAFNNYFGIDTTSPYASEAASTPGTHYGGGNGNVGLTAGQIAALTLDPNKAEPLIHQEIVAAQIGGGGVTAGVGAVSKAEALKLSQAGVTGAPSTFASWANLAPLESALPGQVTNAQTNTLSTDVLTEANTLGTAADVRAQQVAQESRKAPFEGGGGFEQDKSGVAIGSASSSGGPGGS